MATSSFFSFSMLFIEGRRLLFSLLNLVGIFFFRIYFISRLSNMFLYVSVRHILSTGVNFATGRGRDKG